MKRSFRLLAILFLAFTLPLSGDQPITIVCTTDNDIDSLHVAALRKFAQLVREYSNGRLDTEIYYRGDAVNPALWGEEESVTLVMTDVEKLRIPVHVTVVATGNASQQIQALNFLMLPYFLRDTEEAERLFLSSFMRDEINGLIERKHNVRVLGWLMGGFRHLTNSRHPVRALEDLSDLTIRTPRNRLMVHTYHALGAKVVPMDWSDVPAALDRREIDGQENPYNVIVYSEFWRHRQEYITETGVFLWSGPILINAGFYNSLPPDLRAAVDRAGQEAAEWQWQWMEEQEAAYRELLYSKGMIISRLNDKPEWEEATRPLWNDFYRNIGYQDAIAGKELVDRALSIIGNH